MLVAFTGLIAASAASSAANTAPRIWGFAQKWASVGDLYNFQPKSSDAEKNTLTFSITNKPRWAKFNTTTGRLYGTPAAADRKTQSNVVIRASDGKATVAFPAFTLTVIKATGDTPPASTSVTVSWTPPTQNEDGTTLTNLAGYRVLYGKNQSALDKTVNISNVGLTKYVIDGITSGTWYFGVEAYNRAGEESSLSRLVKKNVP